MPQKQQSKQRAALATLCTQQVKNFEIKELLFSSPPIVNYITIVILTVDPQIGENTDLPI